MTARQARRASERRFRFRSRSNCDTKRAGELAASLAALALLACSALELCAGERAQLAGPFPAPPSAANLQLLAKSPASALLASQFLAGEQRAWQPAAPQASAPAPKPPAANSRIASGPAQLSRALPESGFRLDQYHSLDEIYAFLEQLQRRHPHVHLFTIGHTHERRPIKALEIVNNQTDADFVWLDALTHAREWVTGSTLLYVVDQLVGARRPGSGASRHSAARLMHSKNYIVVPVVNPDGYAYTWTSNRMWRKNRSPSAGSQCVGADLNRNFEHSFGGHGSSSDPCSHIYSGAHAFSEPESRSLAELMWSLKARIKFYLTMHSYNQLWACPYASTTEPSASLATHMRVLRAIQRAVRDAEGVTYEVGPLSTSLYVGSGFGLDFAYEQCGIEHSYLVELRDKGAFGFQLPADLIMPTARETYAGLEAGLWSAFAQPSAR